MPAITFPRDAFRQNVMDYTREDYNSGVDACFWRELLNNAGYEAGKRITPTMEGLKFLLARCDMGAIIIKCNGERVYDTKLPGDAVAVREWPQFQTFAYHLPQSRPILDRSGRPVMIVQHRGIWVEDRVISDEIKGCVWVNIKDEPRKVLNAARVSVASYDLRSLFGSFLQEITRSPKTALKTKKGVKRFDGCMTTIQTAQEAARMITQSLLDSMPDKPQVGKIGRPVKVVVDDQRKLLEELANMVFINSGGDTGERLRAQMLDPPRLNIQTNDSNSDIANKMAALAWSPAIMIVNEREQSVDAKFMPFTMGSKARKLLTVWSEMVKQFLILSKAFGCTFGVGFIFSYDTLAQWRKEDDGTVWFLLNPIDADDCLRFDLSSSKCRSVMISEAAHEVTHQICRHSHHGDEFARRLTDLMSLSLDHSQLFNEIWKYRP